MKKLLIIGGGLTSLSAAKELYKNYEITIIEKEDELGGIASAFDLDGVMLDKYYHHIFKSDKYVVDLCKELKIDNELMWLESKMGYFSNNKSYEFGTAMSLLKFKPLNFINKFRFGISILAIKFTNDWKKLENITAKEWLIKYAGNKAYKVVWEPLLKTKFGKDYDKISMSWMWGKIKLRGSSKQDGVEKLGYMNNSYAVLIEKLKEYLTNNNVKIMCNVIVESIDKKEKGYEVKTSEGNIHFDKIISTIAYPIFTKITNNILPKQTIKILNNIKYTSTRCMVLVLKESFMPFYWLNIGDETIPFGGLIEHTNLVDKKIYDNKIILYISNYMYSDDKLYKCSKEELLNEYIKHLVKINPRFSKNMIENFYVFNSDYAQPVIKNNYSSIKPEFKIKDEEIYIAAMPQIYPEDRGLNYAIRLGQEVARAMNGE